MEKIDLPPPSLSRYSLHKLEPSFKDVLQSQASTIMIASRLSTSSRVNFLDLFEDFVLEALSLSPPRLQNFRQQYEGLSQFLYKELLRTPSVKTQISQLTVVRLFPLPHQF
jgi:hypothetical protein